MSKRPHGVILMYYPRKPTSSVWQAPTATSAGTREETEGEMDDEVEWREGDEDGEQVAEVNGWTVMVKAYRSLPGEYHYSTFAACPTCGTRESMGAGASRSMTAAQAQGIALARERKPKYARAEMLVSE